MALVPNASEQQIDMTEVINNDSFAEIPLRKREGFPSGVRRKKENHHFQLRTCGEFPAREQLPWPIGARSFAGSRLAGRPFSELTASALKGSF